MIMALYGRAPPQTPGVCMEAVQQSGEAFVTGNEGLSFLLFRSIM